MTTWSPQSTCGVKLGLCLPRRMLATIVASRPTTRPSASIRCHFFSTSAGLAALVVFISAFMGVDPLANEQRRSCGSGADGGQMAADPRKVKANGGFVERYYITSQITANPFAR